MTTALRLLLWAAMAASVIFSPVFGAAIPIAQLGSTSPKATAGIGSKIAKALTPKPASYHGNKAVASLGSSGAGAIESAFSFVSHPAKGVAGSAMAGWKGVKDVGHLRLFSALKQTGKMVGKPVAGVAGGVYTGARAAAAATADLGRSVYHGAAYPVAKAHEAIRGKPSAAKQAKFDNKFQRFTSKRIYAQKQRMEDHKTVDFLTLGRTKSAKGSRQIY